MSQSETSTSYELIIRMSANSKWLHRDSPGLNSTGRKDDPRTYSQSVIERPEPLKGTTLAVAETSRKIELT